MGVENPFNFTERQFGHRELLLHDPENLFGAENDYLRELFKHVATLRQIFVDLNNQRSVDQLNHLVGNNNQILEHILTSYNGRKVRIAGGLNGAEHLLVLPVDTQQAASLFINQKQDNGDRNDRQKYYEDPGYDQQECSPVITNLDEYPD